MRKTLTQIGHTTMTALGVLVLAATSGPLTYAGSITFNFNSVAYANGDQSTAIANYMDTLVCPGHSCVQVTGAMTDRTWSGDSHVVGAQGGLSYTLGNTTFGSTDGTTSAPTGAYCALTTCPNVGTVLHPVYQNTFIANTDDTGYQDSSQIQITFSGIQVTGASFGYEIFPDGTCPSKSNCGNNYGNWPDLSFKAGNTQIFHYYGMVPGIANGNPNAPNTPQQGTWTSYSWSPAMHSGETAPQLLGTWSGTFAATNTLTFADWPATIGFDNLTIDTPNSAPEPGIPALLGVTLAGVGLGLRRRAGERGKS